MLRPFLPSRDYSLSQRFYEDLGFSIEGGAGNVAVIADGACSFLLQDFYVKDLAENLMVQLVVSDLDAWWRERDPESVAVKFGSRQPIAPAMQPGGRKVGFIHDPCGVLWHVTEA